VSAQTDIYVSEPGQPIPSEVLERIKLSKHYPGKHDQQSHGNWAGGTPAIVTTTAGGKEIIVTPDSYNEVGADEGYVADALSHGPWVYYRNRGFPKEVQEVSAAEFASAFSKARAGRYGPFLSPFTEEDFAADNVRTFTAFGGTVGGALTDHGDGRIEIGSLYSLPGAPPAAGRDMMRYMIHGAGGNWLNNFDGILTEFYQAEGFSVKTRDDWNDEYAPENWDYEAWDNPDYVTMGRP